MRRILRPAIGKAAYRHNPLLIDSLVKFNFRPPILLIFPGETARRHREFA